MHEILRLIEIKKISFSVDMSEEFLYHLPKSYKTYNFNMN